MRFVMGRIKCQQGVDALVKGVALSQPQIAQRLDKQAVLAMTLLRVAVQHHQVRQGDRKKIALYRVVVMLLPPGDKLAETGLGLLMLAEALQRHGLPELIIHRLIVVVASGIQARVALDGLPPGLIGVLGFLLLFGAPAQQIPDVVIGLPGQAAFAKIKWIVQRLFQQVLRAAVIAVMDRL